MTNQFFYPEEDDMNPKKSGAADDPTSDDADSDDAAEAENELDVDDDDLIDDGIEEGEEIE